MGKITDSKIMDNIINLLNKVYTLGFEACGSDLMPKLIKVEKELREKINGIN